MILTRRCLKCNTIFEAESITDKYRIHQLDFRGGWIGDEIISTELTCPCCSSTRTEEFYLDEIIEE